MTVQELIDKLNAIEDKSIDVYIYGDGSTLAEWIDFYNDYIEIY